MGLTQAQITLIGIMIIKFATGFTGDWGVISLYVLSYYHFHGAPIQIKSSTNSLIVIILMIPVTICLIISSKVAHWVGYVRLIKICAVVYLVFPLFSFLSSNFIVFLFCNLLIPCSSFTLALVPIFHCMYSHFGQNKSLATGAVICSFGVGAIVWNFVATLCINPENVIPDIQTSDPNLNFFPLQIANKTPMTMNMIYLISGIIFLIGSRMITINSEYKEDNIIQLDTNVHPQLNQPGHASQLQQQQIQSIGTGAADVSPPEPVNMQAPVDLLPYIKHPISILLFVMNITGCIYQIYVQLNTKLIYMPSLQDDHLISVGLMIIILSSALFGIVWGLLADKKGPPFAIYCFIIVDLAGKIFASMMRSKVGFIFSMIFLGGTDKTMLILFAPILIDCFGLQVATQLLPFKGLSGIFSVLFAAALGLAFAGLAPEKALYLLCIFSFINIGIGICLANIINRQQERRLAAKNQQSL